MDGKKEAVLTLSLSLLRLLQFTVGICEPGTVAFLAALSSFFSRLNCRMNFFFFFYRRFDSEIFFSSPVIVNLLTTFTKVKVR